jgi:hypothetical protein
MVTSVSNIQINRPPAEVFEFITDPGKALIWHLETVGIEGRRGMPAGSTGQIITRVMGQDIVSSFEVVENDGKSLTVARSTQGPLRFETKQIVIPLADGQSLVRIETRIDAGAIFRLAEPVVESLLRTSIDADLQTLKVVLENHISATPR